MQAPHSWQAILLRAGPPIVRIKNFKSQFRSRKTRLFNLRAIPFHASGVFAGHLGRRELGCCGYLPGALRCAHVCNYRRLSSLAGASHLPHQQSFPVSDRVHRNSVVSERSPMVVSTSPPSSPRRRYKRGFPFAADAQVLARTLWLVPFRG